MKILRIIIISIGIIASIATSLLTMWLIFIDHNIMNDIAIWTNIPADLLNILLIGSLFGLLILIQIYFYQSRQ